VETVSALAQQVQEAGVETAVADGEDVKAVVRLEAIPKEREVTVGTIHLVVWAEWD
jgi:hypothetical protein